jgi:hypothetical protein
LASPETLIPQKVYRITAQILELLVLSFNKAPRDLPSQNVAFPKIDM